MYYGKEIIRNSNGDLIYINNSGASPSTYFYDIADNYVFGGKTLGLLVGGRPYSMYDCGFGCLNSA